MSSATGIKSLKVRHNNILGFYHRGHGSSTPSRCSTPPLAETFRHRQTMANAMRFTTAELVEIEGRIASAAERALAIEQEVFAELAARDRRRGAGARRRSPAHWPSSMHRPALAELAEPRATCAPTSTTARRFEIAAAAIRWSSRRCERPRPAPFIENDCVLGRAARPPQPPASTRAADAPHLARHRPEHGRQVDVPAPERADRGAGADGLLRAGARGAHRRRRPAVLARRRLRRPRARPLDVHGRDGRDGRHPQPGDRALASSSSTRSAAAPRPSTASRSPGRRSSTCTTSTAAGRCSRRTTTS